MLHSIRNGLGMLWDVTGTSVSHGSSGSFRLGALSVPLPRDRGQTLQEHLKSSGVCGVPRCGCSGSVGP